MFITDKHALYLAHKRLPASVMYNSFKPSIDMIVNLNAGIGYYADVVYDTRNAQVRESRVLLHSFPNILRENIKAQSRFCARHLHGRVNREYRVKDPASMQHFYLSARWQRKLLFAMFMRESESTLWDVIENGSDAKLDQCSMLAKWAYTTPIGERVKCKELLKAYRRKVWERIHGA